MPTQRVMVEKAGSSRRGAPKGYARSTLDSLTSTENRAMVTSIVAFGVRIFPFLWRWQTPRRASLVAYVLDVANLLNRPPSPSSLVLGPNSCLFRESTLRYMDKIQRLTIHHHAGHEIQCTTSNRLRKRSAHCVGLYHMRRPTVQ